jgi:DNA helicase-2/ATP-dependent DNA helicase PcrA
LVAQRPPGPAVEYRKFPDDAAEAAGTAARIAQLITGGVDPGQIAVLYRTNAQSEQFENALADTGIGYHVRGGERFFARQEVRQVLAVARVEARAESDLDGQERLLGLLREAGWAEQAPTVRGALRERWESLDALARLAGDLAKQGVSSLAQLVEAISQRADMGLSPTPSGVTLASLHSAKGLEWEAVFLVGLADGLLPITLAERPAEIEEERRLLYVGITRAKTHLVCSFAAARHAGGAAKRRASRFLGGLWPTAERSATAANGLDVPGEEALTAAQADRLQTLKAWRSGQAKAAGLPVYTVLPDVTLRALASRPPGSMTELAAIAGIGPAKLAKYGTELVALLAVR